MGLAGYKTVSSKMEVQSNTAMPIGKYLKLKITSNCMLATEVRNTEGRKVNCYEDSVLWDQKF